MFASNGPMANRQLGIIKETNWSHVTLDDVAWAIHKLPPEAQERIGKLAWQWSRAFAEEWTRWDAATPRDEHREPIPLLPLRPRQYALREKAAILARVHDLYLDGEVDPIGPSAASLRDPGDTNLIWPYERLICPNTPQITDADSHQLWKFLNDVEENLLMHKGHPSKVCLFHTDPLSL